MAKEYIVLSRQDSVARNGSPFINIKVANLEGNENICVFDVQKDKGPAVGQLVQFMSIRDYQGKKSANNMDMVVGVMPTEKHPLFELIPRPIKKEDWDLCVNNLLAFCTDERLIPFRSTPKSSTSHTA